MTKKILFIVSSAASIGPKNRKTGNFLPEVSHPYSAFVEQGYEIDFASIKGGSAPLDGTDLLDDPLNKSFMEGEGAKSFAATHEIDSVDTSAYDAIFVPGGLGPMADMPDNETVQHAIADTYERGAVVGAVCHGPVSLLNVNLSDGSALIDGKTIASFTNEEEEGYAKEDVPFLLESALKEKGAKFISVAPWQPNSIADGKLVTGQNPASAIGVAEKMIGILEN